MIIIRSIIFNLFFYLWNAVCFVLFIPFYVNYKWCYRVSKIWAMGLIWGLKKIIGVEIIVEGWENLPKNSGCVIASKHQSAFETFFYWVLPNVAFVYKKELSYIPLFGFYHIVLKNIAVDRKAGGTALKKVLNQTKQRVKDGRSVVIFPEGTRTKVGQKVEYKPAIYGIYKIPEIPVLPASLNSADIWPKGAFIKKPGTIRVTIFPPMQKGMEKEGFMRELKGKLESNCK